MTSTGGRVRYAIAALPETAGANGKGGSAAKLTT
jgi:hypothetical protein